jgi:hypothetical protein
MSPTCNLHAQQETLQFEPLRATWFGQNRDDFIRFSPFPRRVPQRERIVQPPRDC